MQERVTVIEDSRDEHDDCKCKHSSDQRNRCAHIGARINAARVMFVLNVRRHVGDFYCIVVTE